MSKKKITKLQCSEEHNKLIQLFYENSPEERQKLLTNIDTFICRMLDLKEDDLPWLNPDQHDYKWEEIMFKFRLLVGKIELEAYKKSKTVH